MENSENLKVGDYIECVGGLNESLITNGNTYRVIETHKDNNSLYYNMVTILNDLGHLDIYYTSRFKLDVIAIRCETIDNILE